MEEKLTGIGPTRPGQVPEHCKRGGNASKTNAAEMSCYIGKDESALLRR